MGIWQVVNRGTALWVLGKVGHSEGPGDGSEGRVLVCKPEDVGSDPQHQHKARGSSWVCNPSIEGWRQADPRGLV